jgi:hypothetical protein
MPNRHDAPPAFLIPSGKLLTSSGSLKIREPHLQLHSMDADKNLSNTDDAMNPV